MGEVSLKKRKDSGFPRCLPCHWQCHEKNSYCSTNMFYHQNAPKQLNITITRFRVDVNIFLKIHGLKPSKTEIHNKRKRRISRCEFLDRLLRIGRFPHTTVFDYYYTQNGRKINVFMSRNFEECQVFGLFHTKKSWFSWHCSLYGAMTHRLRRRESLPL